MANLPTAHASQRFGRKTIDFYAVSGEVVGADPRARTDERRIQDLDGARHTLRLMDRGFTLQPGDYASVLRLQPGPERRSRPVAVANPAGQGWARTHPGIPALLSRSGIARNVNWWMTILLFTLAALAIAWPYLHALLAELAPGWAGALPAPDVFALAAAYLPGLEAWRWSDAASWMTPLLEPAGAGLADQSGAILFAGLAAALAVTTYASRSWRLVWAPLFVALAVAGAIGLDGPGAAAGPALAVLGAAALLFIIGGLINRTRDSVRLERRIAMLAEHMMTHTPTEHVRAPRSPVISDAAAPAAAGAAALREPAPEADPEADTEAEPEAKAEAGTESAGEPGAEDGAAREDANDSAATALPEAEADAGVPPAGAAPEAANDAETIEADGFVDPDLAVPPAPPAPEPADQDALSAAPAEESEEEARLRTDPRYAARAIVLPAPPPMPRRDDAAAPVFAASAEEGGDAAQPESAEAPQEGTQTAQSEETDGAGQTR
ncbi:MAG: hypothetical protein JJU18_01325 [Oceanicaulis sp.]|nr:hypothetical protein [Oceanicaulis sp.]